MAGAQVASSWHWSGAPHVTGFAPVHVPFWQVSVRVQAVPSLHALPLALAGFVHSPVDGLHVPAVWHWSSAVQTTASPPEQLPFEQVSVRVHALPSPQAVPFGLLGFEQTPVAGSQTPVSWQALLATHTTGLPPTHTPA
jgi:hypothetical protein